MHTYMLIYVNLWTLKQNLLFYCSKQTSVVLFKLIHHSVILSAAGPGDEQELVISPTILVTELFFPHWTVTNTSLSSKENTSISWVFIHFILVKVPSILLLNRKLRKLSQIWTNGLLPALMKWHVQGSNRALLASRHIIQSILCSLLPYPNICASFLYHFWCYVIISTLSWNVWEWITLSCFIKGRFSDVAIMKWFITGICVSVIVFMKPLLLKWRTQSVQTIKTRIKTNIFQDGFALSVLSAKYILYTVILL